MGVYFQNLIAGLTSQTFNIILTLLLVFQWLRSYAKEQSIINNVIAMRRIIERGKGGGASNKKDVIEILDATLATLGARSPFVKKMKQAVTYARDLMSKEENGDIKT